MCSSGVSLTFKDVEIFGSGFRKVYTLCDKYSVRVDAENESDGFSFVFYRDYKPNNVTKNDTINVKDQNMAEKIPTDAKVYMLLKEDPTQTREVLAGKAGRTVRTIQRALKKLSREGKIKRIGSNKTGYWELL